MVSVTLMDGVKDEAKRTLWLKVNILKLLVDFQVGFGMNCSAVFIPTAFLRALNTAALYLCWGELFTNDQHTFSLPISLLAALGTFVIAQSAQSAKVAHKSNKEFNLQT